MPLTDFNFTTGPASLPDAGVLFYNGCLFSPLFVSSVSGRAVKDNARRTVKYMEYVITVDGYATLPAGQRTINNVTTNLRSRLTAQGGSLAYQGRGMDLTINPPFGAGGTRDVAWGPVPELLDFQPLGDGRSAKIVWKVTVRVPEVKGKLADGTVVRAGNVPVPLLQFNYDTVVSYDEAGFSCLSMKGTLEIPLTRGANQDPNDRAARVFALTADDLREVITNRILQFIDLATFRVTRRNFSVSRDKRTLEWDVQAEERPYMDLPPSCTVARGTYSVRPARVGMGLVTWLCTLRATYTVRADRPRRLAWFAFLALLRRRMVESRHGVLPKLNGDQNPRKGIFKLIFDAIPGAVAPGAIELWKKLFQKQGKLGDGRKAWLIDFSFDEGMYLDSKTISFSATWRLNTVFSHILLASGIWTKVAEKNDFNINLWATSVVDVSRERSWLTNRLDPKLDVIVDFGGG